MTNFFKSFTYAFQGIWFGLQERNMRFHLFATLMVITMGWYFHVTETEWLVLFLAIGMVLSAELFNTALEYVCSAIAPLHSDLHKQMGKPKDIGAAAVLVAACAALIIGLIIFVPHIVSLLQVL